jgi:hypothetical protein
MRIRISAYVFGCALVAGCSAQPGPSPLSKGALPKYVPDHVIVKYRAEALSSTNADEVRKGVRSQVAGRPLGALDAAQGVELLDVGALGVENAIARLEGDERVEVVEPDYVLQPFAIPNDLFFNQQWGAQNTGQFSGTPHADVDATEAWDIRTDCRGPLVAVIDGPIALPHEDLTMWVNPGEDIDHDGVWGPDDINGIDDDGDGYIDDGQGWDFYEHDNDVASMGIEANHASVVAGVIGAIGNNGKGIAGVCWQANILPLRFMQGVTGGATSDAILAINYAVMKGAKVINASWGGDSPSTLLEQAIAAAGNAGVLFVAAAGNSDRDVDQIPTYPACFPEANIISVIGSTQQDTFPSAYSNFGAMNTDLAAPGVSVLGPTPANGYTQESGTSFAAPWVSGAATMLFAQRPSAGVADVKNAILSSVDVLPAFSGLTSTGGRLNLHKALLAIGSGGGGGASGLPDLVVTSVSWSPENVAAGQQATFSATVLNQGTGATPAGVIIGVQFDVDGAEISWSDTDTQSLAAGASVTLTANSGPTGSSVWTATSGPHTITAWVNDVNRFAESDENNNKLSVPMSVGIDLTVTSLSFTPTNPTSGTPVTFSATVQNVGTVATPAGTIIGVQFDVDGAQISWSDTDTQSLAPGASMTLTANSGPTGSSTWIASSGAHTIQAWVDDVNRMNDVNRNNNSLSVPLSVGIDLTVTGVSWSPASPTSGAPVTFSATVQNVGTVATPAGTIVGVQFDVDGVEIGWSDADTQSLAPGASVTLTANSGPTGGSTWPATSGTHSVLAWVDDVNRFNDVNRNNNQETVSLTVP